MKYDFTTIMNRFGEDAIAVDLPASRTGGYADIHLHEGFDIIPMWVADMNFPVLPDIQEAMITRIQKPHFGYFSARDEYFDAIIRWQKQRNHVEGLEKKHIGYENGVLGGVTSAMNILTSKGGKVLVHSPVYVGFSHVLNNNGYQIIQSPLVKDESNVWRMDFEDMERKLRDEHIHTAIFCNPHNPCGRAWEKEEIEQAMALYEKYEVEVISDEIWSDLVHHGHQHIPTQSVSPYAHEHTIAFYAPSKTFNLAGLIGSYHIVYNAKLRDRLEKEGSLSHYNSMNLLSMYALIGAYGDNGMEYVRQLNHVFEENIDYAVDFIENRLPGVSVCSPKATYMLWIDVSGYLENAGTDLDTLIHRGYDYGVIWQDGRGFFGQTNIRMNLALPLCRVKEAFERLQKYVFI
ncbi:MAG: aminotransferase class I/II-fold pyridoxal phosphate-dependent enzyme [Solobacterium sp.]|nr:aminotransferase class I/II-fold pyridoxal phosphate-dependent enzyme [Solobacterium sp.]